MISSCFVSHFEYVIWTKIFHKSVDGRWSLSVNCQSVLVNWQTRLYNSYVRELLWMTVMIWLRGFWRETVAVCPHSRMCNVGCVNSRCQAVSRVTVESQPSLIYVYGDWWFHINEFDCINWPHSFAYLAMSLVPSRCVKLRTRREGEMRDVITGASRRYRSIW